LFSFVCIEDVILEALDYESEGREFESLRARHKINKLPGY
jgi:hypothetical protein